MFLNQRWIEGSRERCGVTRELSEADTAFPLLVTGALEHSSRPAGRSDTHRSRQIRDRQTPRCYSYLNVREGSRRAALRAGHQPAAIPVSARIVADAARV